MRILLASLNLLNDERARGETGKAGELTSELLFPFTIGAAADDDSLTVPSKTVVVPSVLCTRMGGAGADTPLRGPSGNLLVPLRDVIAFLLSAIAAVLLHGFISD